MQVGEVVELRVHGVSGTPPQELLDRPLVDLVAGDGTAGFYRPRLAAEASDSAPAGVADPVVQGPVLEGYAWGGLTSGAPSRAFWLLLLPFTLINVAPRMRPADPDLPDAASARRLWWLWFVCRLLGLTLTVVLVAAFVGIGDDLIGWQCGSTDGRCANASPAWVMSRIAARSTAHRLAIGSLLPLLALAFLWFISKRTINRYEEVPAGLAKSVAERTAMWDRIDPIDAVDVGLRSRWMWQNEFPVRRLRALHLQLGTAAVLAFVSAAMTPAWRWIDGMLAIAVALYSVVALCQASFTGHSVAMGWRRISLAVWIALGAATAGTGLWLLLRPGAIDDRFTDCGFSGLTCRPSGGLPRYADTLLWLLFVELILLTALFVIVARSSVKAGTRIVVGEPGPSAALRGGGTAVLAVIAVFLAAVFTAGSYLYAAAWLRTGSLKPGFGTISAISTHFVVPEAILDASLAYAVSVGVLLATLVVAGIWGSVAYAKISPTTAPISPGAFDDDYPDVDDDARSAKRRKTVLRALWFGRLVDVAGTFLGWLVVVGLALTYAVAGILFAEHVGHARGAARWLLYARDPDNPDQYRGFFAPSSLQGAGAYLAVGTLLLLVGLGAAAFRVGPTRRSVGILWDLASFWPRLAHPLAAPCYAERTVPDLLSRIRWHTRQSGGVVLAAHSQGTVIGAAALLQLRTDDALDRDSRALGGIGLLTFGCVLRRLYGRFFPAYFGPRTLRDLRTALRISDHDQRWRNLWRYSDYLGGPVASGPPPARQPAWTPDDPANADLIGPGGLHLDLHLVDPPFAIRPGDTVYPPPLRHSAYWAVPEFQHAVVQVAGLITAPADRSTGSGGVRQTT
jgi:hypothetical protein